MFLKVYLLTYLDPSGLASLEPFAPNERLIVAITTMSIVIATAY